MPPVADVGGSANRQVPDGSMGLRPSSGRGSQGKDKGGGKNGENKSSGLSALSARERLRLHVNRNLALQQEAGRGGSDRGPASAGSPTAPPRGASPANSSTPPPTSAQQPLAKIGANSRQNYGLHGLYGPITDTRLGRHDISQGPNSAGSTTQSNTTSSTPVQSAVEMLDVPLNMSFDMGDQLVQSSPLASGEEEEETESAFDPSDMTETPPFIPTAEWADSSLGGDNSQLYYNEDGCRGGPDGVVDDEWVQGLYDMEGMA